MLDRGGLHDTVLLMFLVGVDNGVSQIYYLGPGASVALQIQGCGVGILAVRHLLAGFLLDECHSARSWLVDQVLACLVACCSAMKNNMNSLSGTLVQLVVSWGDPEVGWLQYVWDQQSGTKMNSFPLLFPSYPQEIQFYNHFSMSSTDSM